MVLNVYISEAVCDELLRFLDPRDVAWLSTVARSTQQEVGGLLRQRDLQLPEDLRVNFNDGYFNIAAGFILLLQREGSYHPMIYALGGGSVTSAAGSLHVSDSDTVSSFDPFTRIWASCPSMPTPRTHHCAAAVDGRIWAVGGVSRVRDCAIAEVESFDPTRPQRWTSHTPMTQPRHSFGCTGLDGKLYVVGGEYSVGRAHGRIGDMEIFDPATNQWTTGPSLPLARNRLTLEAVNGKLFVIGGCFDEEDDGYEEVNYGPTAEIPTAAVECFDLQTGLWSPAAPMKIPRSGHASTVVNSCVIVMGGVSQDGHATNTVECFNPMSNTWTMLPSMTFTRENFGAATWKGTVIAVGGCMPMGQNGECFRVLPGQEEASWVPIPDMEDTRLGLCVAATG